MAQISVNNLTFAYEGSYDNIFENVSFLIDTDWKLGFIGRNGKGKTTFFNLLRGKYKYEGTINTKAVFDYFPYSIKEEQMDKNADELIEFWNPNVESWKVICEMAKLSIDTEVLYRPVSTLSFGERTKIMLAVLFSGENQFLLIDEPTNHLDKAARDCVKQYLSEKKGFILISHDRDFMDACVDHVLILNRETIEVQSGNFSSWWENKEKADHFAKAQNEKHLKEIDKLKSAADRANRWAIKSENSKIGFDPVKEPERFIDTRAYIGAKTKKQQARVKAFEGRMEREIQRKEGLLKDIEEVKQLKINPLKHFKNRLIEARNFSFCYCDAKEPVFSDLTFEITQGERVFLQGENGCGKSSFIKAILEQGKTDRFNTLGILEIASNLVISYVNQDTSHLKGKLKKYAIDNNLEYSLLLSLLNQLDFEKVQYEKNMEDFSEGQKKKVLLAASLLTPAHLYIWDEPLNYVDIFSRMQIEKLIEMYNPTMLLVEHDTAFREKIATKVIEL